MQILLNPDMHILVNPVLDLITESFPGTFFPLPVIPISKSALDSVGFIPLCLSRADLGHPVSLLYLRSGHFVPPCYQGNRILTVHCGESLLAHQTISFLSFPFLEMLFCCTLLLLVTAFRSLYPQSISLQPLFSTIVIKQTEPVSEILDSPIISMKWQSGRDCWVNVFTQWLTLAPEEGSCCFKNTGILWFMAGLFSLLVLLKMSIFNYAENTSIKIWLSLLGLCTWKRKHGAFA